MSVFKEFDMYDDMGGTTSEDVFEDAATPASVTAAVEYFEGHGATVDIQRAHGDPAEAIVKVADDLDIDMIAMGGRQRTPAGKVLFGSVTQGVLLNAERPVFVTFTE